MSQAISAEGACYCGAVEYKVEGQLLLNALCHCMDCQGSRGVSPVHTMAIAPSDCVKVTKGEELLSTINRNGGVSRCFCSKCGTLVHQGPIGAPFRAVLPVTFKCGRPLPKEYWPTMHVHYESRTHDTDDSLPKHEAEKEVLQAELASAPPGLGRET